MIIIKDYLCKVGVAFFGGAGSNILRGVINTHVPEEYPEYYLFGANTDLKVHNKHFGNADEPHQKSWEKDRRLKIYQLGEEEVTNGLGAGADPEVGRKAAETEKSKAAMSEFFNSVDQLFLLGGLGGGTGTGALPVAAKLAVEMGKSVVAIVIMPKRVEGRDKRALAALKEIQSQVPTFVIQSNFMKEYMKSFSEERRASLSTDEARNIIDEIAVYPLLLGLREILQKAGNIKNVDEADYMTAKGRGKHGIFGMAKLDPQTATNEKPGDIVARLFAGLFQDPLVIKRGNVGLLWFHGAIPEQTLDGVLGEVRKGMAGDAEGKLDDLEIFYGIDTDVKDERWIFFIAFADVHQPEAGVQAEKTITVPATGSQRLVENYSTIESSVTLRFPHKGKMESVRVPSALGKRYSSVAHTLPHKITQAVLDEFEKVANDIELLIQKRPDVPQSFQEYVEALKMSQTSKSA